MTGTRWALGALMVCLLGSGCSGDAEPKSAKAVEETTSSATAEVEPMAMTDVCPEVEAALPSAYIPGVSKMIDYVDRLNELAEQGDTETQNALELLIPQAEDLRDAVIADARGSELLDPLRAHLDGVTAFADRCKAAGSSALQ